MAKKIATAADETAATKTAKAPVPRLRPAERRAQILAAASTYFSEHGLGTQTRAIAEACGVTQRLLYRYFPSKAALLSAVYDEQIVAPFKAVWIVKLKDRSVPVKTRIEEFYEDYFASVLTRHWLRLFMHASLSDSGMAPNYINAIIKQLLLVIAEEVAKGHAPRSGNCLDPSRNDLSPCHSPAPLWRGPVGFGSRRPAHPCRQLHRRFRRGLRRSTRR